MSIQFGRWNIDDRPVERDYLEKVKSVIARYGPDGGGSFSNAGISILYRAFHTTKESRHESQPHVTELGAIITWDGRLDNRAELMRQLHHHPAIGPTDVSIVAAAYDVWGTNCFAKFIGDWALSVWDAHSQSLILAKDPIGPRHLYYAIERNQITWSTLLDPLVSFAGHSFELNEEYVAGWFSFFPAVHLTPYIGIHSVPPSSFVTLQAGKHTIRKYWEFDPAKRIRYRSDNEYEEHFRAAFGEAVRRRLRSDTPIVAELSGGMDSSSIVCMADALMAGAATETPRLDTVSYYNDSEPNWNERPYFTRVEEKRGRTGCHIDVAEREKAMLDPNNDRFAATPGSGLPADVRFVECLTSQGNRVVLSGLGGDEVTGGVPTPTPELEDLLATVELRTLAHQLKVWALNKRRPWLQLFLEAARGFFPPGLVGVPKHKRPVPWLCSSFVERNRAALQGYKRRLKLFGPLPSFQDNLSTLEGLKRQQLCSPLSLHPIYEKRYPYLDRDLLEFIYAIPREQLVRPGQRRSLMRRSLVRIVPDEILHRKRKAFVVRTPLAEIAAQRPHLLELSQHMVSDSLGIVDSLDFADALHKVGSNRELALVPLMRTLHVEFWLRNLSAWRVLGSTNPQSVMQTVRCLPRSE